GGGGVPDARAIGGGGGGPADTRATGAIGIGGAGRIDVGCEPLDARPGGGGGVGTGTGADGQPLTVDRPTGATMPPGTPSGGAGGTKAGGGTTPAEGASG